MVQSLFINLPIYLNYLPKLSSRSMINLSSKDRFLFLHINKNYFQIYKHHQGVIIIL